MGLTGCYAVMKYLVFFLNFIFWVTGLCVIVLSLWMLTDPTFYVSMAQDESSYYSGVYLLLAVGILLLIVGFLGCCGALRESQLMLVLFVCVLVIVVVGEVSAAAWAYSKSAELEAVVRDTVTSTVQHEYSTTESRTHTFDAIQRGLRCCGAKGPDDWWGTKYNDVESLDLGITSKESTVYKIPASCCSSQEVAECEPALKLRRGAPVSALIFTEGCSDKLIATLRENMETVVAIGVLIGIAQLLGLIFSLVLCCAIQQRDRYKA